MRRPAFTSLSALALLSTAALLAACAGRATSPSASASAMATPAHASIDTPKVPVVDEYHGVKVTDNYRWLEDWSDPKVQAWSESQNAAARNYLDSLPSAPSVRERLIALESSESVSYSHLAPVNGGFLAIKHQPPKQQGFLVFLPNLTDTASERTVVDPNVLDPKGLTTIDWFVPSPDSSRLAVSMSVGGSEAGDVTIFDLATGATTRDFVPRVHGGTAGGSLAWNADGTGFFYTRYPREGERMSDEMDFYQKVYFHTIGSSGDRDTYEMGNEFDADTAKIAEIQLDRSANGKFILASVQKGDGGQFLHFLRPTAAGSVWTQFTNYPDEIVYATFGGDGNIYAVSNRGTPRGSVVRFDPVALATPGTMPAHDVVIPEGSDSIAADFHEHNGLWVTAKRAFVLYQTGGPSELRAFGLDGSSMGTVETEAISEIGDAAAMADGSLVFESQSFITPPAWFSVAAGSMHPERTALAESSPATFEGCEVVREFATSKDGTNVPVNIIKHKGVTLDGTNPTILNGYGGYGVNITPSFSPRRQLWLERGGIFVVANIRGGGEFGEEWHRQGNLLNKQNVFDDFAACARYLVEKKYTNPDKLAIMGGSNGGLLMGATITQNPGICKAVVSSVGIYDMLRVELSSNGAFNITEFGTVKDAAQFKALYAYSPYHHVKTGTTYPAVLFTTGQNDPRVDPMQSRKMTALLQAASPGSVTLLRTSASSGHGIGSSLSERIEQNVDVYSFLIEQLGAK